MAVRISAARRAVRGRGARLAVRPSAARKTTSAPQRTGWTWPWDQQPEAPAPAADSTMLLTILVSIFTIVMLQKAFIDDNSAVLTLKMELANKDLTSKLEATNTKLDANTAGIKENTASIKELNAKMDNFSATVQAQQTETARLQGLVSGLQEGVRRK